MPKLKVIKDLNHAIDMLSAVADKAQDIVEAGLYEGADVVGDALRENVSALPTDERWGYETPKAGPSAAEKKVMLNGMGISEFKTENGRTHTSVGFGGYGGYRTKRFPDGKPVALIARSVERGTSFMRPNPFMKQTKAQAHNAAIAAISAKIHEEIQKLTK